MPEPAENPPHFIRSCDLSYYHWTTLATQKGGGWHVRLAVDFRLLVLWWKNENQTDQSNSPYSVMFWYSLHLISQFSVFHDGTSNLKLTVLPYLPFSPAAPPLNLSPTAPPLPHPTPTLSHSSTHLAKGISHHCPHVGVNLQRHSI